MTGSQLSNLPTIDELVAARPEDTEVAEWRNAVFARVASDYIGAWFAWYTDNRQQFQKTNWSDESFARTYKNYAKIIGQHTPGFFKGVALIQSLDPEAKKPILDFYFRAIVRTLSSLEIFQNKFQKEETGSISPLTRAVMTEKFEDLKGKDLPLPYPFLALANGYEHTLSFLARALSEFRETFGQLPDRQEFDQLARELIFKLNRETLLSRRENAILEFSVDNADRCFSITKEKGQIRLEFGAPPPDQKVAILEKFERELTPEERKIQDLKTPLARHYGCPAATNKHKGQRPTGFVFEDVTAAVRKALWLPDYVDARINLMAEKLYRALGGSKPEIQ